MLSSCISALASAPSAAIQVFNGGVITLYKQGDRVCTRLEQTDLSSFSCYDEITIRSGLAYSLLQARDNLYLLGLVPDDASAVTVNGKPVTLDHNIWHTSDKVGTQLSVTIYDDEGHAVASLGSNGS